MGSWNAGCAVSGLTIEYGDPVVLIPFMNKGQQNYPIMLPVRGEYDDGGSISDVKYNKLTKSLEKNILKKSFLFCEVVDEKSGEKVEITEENKYDKFIDIIPKDKTGLWFGREYTERCAKTLPKNLEEFFGAVERQMCLGKYEDNVVRISDYKHDWKEIGFILVHESVYDWVVSNKHVDLEFRTPSNIDEKIDSIPDGFFKKQLDFYESTKYTNLISSFLDENREENYHMCGAPYPYECKSKDDLKEYFKITTEFLKFRLMFKFLRKSYAPDIYAGSQGDNLAAIKELNSFTNKCIPTLKKTRKARYGD